jgi:hypothetical protein
MTVYVASVAGNYSRRSGFLCAMVMPANPVSGLTHSRAGPLLHVDSFAVCRGGDQYIL